jgi:hypothetical protein
MYDTHPTPAGPATSEDPLGPVATMSSTHPVTFGAREAALAGVGSDGDQPPSAAFTWHITCSSITLASGAAQDGDQT